MKFLSVIILTALFAASAEGMPAQIVLVRHGEKPTGQDQGTQLTPAGCQRAMLLPKFFAENQIVERFGIPAAVFASRPDGTEKSSMRPIQTAAPTAAELPQLLSGEKHLSVQAPFVADQYAELASLVMKDPAYDRKTVLVVWDHSKILELAQAFGATLPPNLVKWPGYVYDEALVIRPGKELKIIPESVLPGDNPEGDVHWKRKTAVAPSGPPVPRAIVAECKDNDQLNELVRSIVTPSL